MRQREEELQRRSAERPSQYGNTGSPLRQKSGSPMARSSYILTDERRDSPLRPSSKDRKNLNEDNKGVHKRRKPAQEVQTPGFLESAKPRQSHSNLREELERAVSRSNTD